MLEQRDRGSSMTISAWPGEDFTSVTGFLIDDHFYGTVYMRDTVHYLEPHNRKSRDMHIFGDGLKTLLHK